MMDHRKLLIKRFKYNFKLRNRHPEFRRQARKELAALRWGRNRSHRKMREAIEARLAPWLAISGRL